MRKKMTGTAIGSIHEQMESNPFYPYNVQSGWLPEPKSTSMQKFFKKVLGARKKPYAKSVKEMDRFIEKHEVIKYLVDNACKENLNIIDSHFEDTPPIPRIKDKETILNAFNTILKQAPEFVDNELVGLPFSAFVVGIDPTLSGSTLFSLPMFNDKMRKILNDWHKFLNTKKSNVGFRVNGKQWLSPAAKKQYNFPIWQKDSEKLPYWKSWNSFFTRTFKNKDKSRPIASPDTNRVVISPNDGSLFRWERDISARDVFWFKDMKYSLSDILSSPDPKQQEIIDEHKLVKMFTGGYIFQTYLNPYNFHRWWCPVNGTILFNPLTIPGFFFNKLVIPDFGGATTASLPYLAQVNARGLIVFKTEDYGHVCCIPLGMSEVSTIAFDKKMKSGATVKKGQEMGMFNYGGSSFATIYENLPDKLLYFVNDKGVPYDQQPVLPKGSAGAGGEATWIGSQIGIWVDN